ncbi:unnamed protein product [Cylindrotheca closterium]|uniref:DOMON domain-containing protein n=1 Tax=Cylindrotheca closterium TaxID=2856 RepID=A0AAD2G2K1_9STRA|nr:unnamed protein product [Cylindrotheca closterium]
MPGYLLILLLSLIHIYTVNSTTDVASNYFSNLSSAEKATFLNWLDAKFGTSVSQHSFLTSSSNADNGAAVFWEINGDEIEFAIVVRASGWVALGISEAGGMFGSDVVYYESSNPNTVVDSHIMDSRAAPLVDDCQNWSFLSTTIEQGWLILEVRRPLDTGDFQDHVLRNDEELWMAPTRLIAAWGDDNSLGYHGLNTARNSVRLFSKNSGSTSSALQASLDSKSDGSFVVTESSYQIPTRDTTYHELCMTYSDIQQEIGTATVPLTLIGAIPIITEETRAFVHHFTVYIQPSCQNDLQARSMIYVWGPGHEGMSLPDNVGFPLFEADDKQAIWIQIHYNNHSGVSGMRDSSGVRFYYTETARAEEAGMLELGDPLVRLYGQSISNGLSKYEFTCPGSCSGLFLAQRQVTVIAEFLHMHQTGVRMTNEVIRQNEVVHNAKVDVFDFEEQGGFRVPQDPFTVTPGDTFRTSCYYRDGGAFGLSSQEEMCIAYLLYYPAISNFGFNWGCPYGAGTPICAQELENEDLAGEIDLNRVFGSSGGVCPAASPAPSAQATDNPTFDPTLSPTETNDESTSPTLSPTQMPVSGSPPPPTSRPIDVQESSPPTNRKDESASPTVSPTQMPFSDDAPTLSSPEPPTNVVDSATQTPGLGMLLWIGVLCTALALV